VRDNKANVTMDKPAQESATEQEAKLQPSGPQGDKPVESSSSTAATATMDTLDKPSVAAAPVTTVKSDVINTTDSKQERPANQDEPAAKRAKISDENQDPTTSAATATTTATTDAAATSSDIPTAVSKEENASLDATTSAANNDNNNNDNNNEGTANEEGVLDICNQIGLKAGHRLEVEWQLEETPEEGGEPKLVTRWWGCTLQPYDGRTNEGVAVRVLDYDPYPAGGFPERSLEEVIFLSHDLCISPENHAEFKFRPEGVVTVENEEEARTIVNTIISGTMEKHSHLWRNLTPAQQATIAAQVAAKKERLVEAIMSRSRSTVIGEESMREILQEVMKPKKK